MDYRVYIGVIHRNNGKHMETTILGNIYIYIYIYICICICIFMTPPKTAESAREHASRADLLRSFFQQNHKASSRDGMSRE